MKQFYQKYKPFYRDNLKLAVPVMISQLGQTTVQMADSIIIGRFSLTSDISLASVALANAIFFVILVLGLGISNGLTPLIAQENGAKNPLACSKLLINSLFINSLIGILLCGIVLAVNYLLLDHLNQNPLVVLKTKPYLTYMAFSMIPLMVFQTFKQFAEGLGFTKQAMYISIWGNILNIVLGIILVRGLFGFPVLDVNGVGISTLIDRVLMGICMSYFVLKSKYFKSYIAMMHWKQIKKNTIKRILKIGAPVALQYTFEVSAFSGANIIIGSISAAEAAAHQIALSLASATYMLAGGIAAAATIKAGNYFGAKEFVGLRKSALASYHMVILFMLGAAMLFLFGNKMLASIYVPNNPIVANMAAQLLVIAGLFQLFDGTQVVGLGILRGLSDVNKPTIITFVSYWLFGLPIGYILGVYLHLGAQGVWLGLTAALCLSSILLGSRFQILSKKLIRN